MKKKEELKIEHPYESVNPLKLFQEVGYSDFHYCLPLSGCLTCFLYNGGEDKSELIMFCPGVISHPYNDEIMLIPSTHDDETFLPLKPGQILIQTDIDDYFIMRRDKFEKTFGLSE